MESHEENVSHYVKRVVLPSGKTIEVVLFGEGAPTGDGSSSVAEPRQDLHMCPSCDSHLVYPTAWQEAGPDTWDVVLRCPECEHVREGIFEQRTVDAFDAELDAGTDALTADYRRLMRANMAEEVDRFVAALHVDAILPEDF
jgi:hypothetical protein